MNERSNLESYRAKVHAPKRFHRNLLVLRPSMTGMERVNGPDFLSWQEKIDLDVFNMEIVSPMLDHASCGMTDKVFMAGCGIRFEKHDALTSHEDLLGRRIGENRVREQLNYLKVVGQ